MKTVKVVWGFLMGVLLALERSSVPIAAGVLGWIFGDRLVLWVLEGITSDPGFRRVFADSWLLVYGVRTVVAVILFVIGWRYR